MKYDLFDLILYLPSTIFQLCRDGSSWFEPVQSRINVTCSRTQRSGTGEAGTREPSVSSQALYYWATGLPKWSMKISIKIRQFQPYLVMVSHPRGQTLWNSEIASLSRTQTIEHWISNRFYFAMKQTVRCIQIGESSKFPKSWTFEISILELAVCLLNIHNFKIKWSIILRQTENKSEKLI